MQVIGPLAELMPRSGWGCSTRVVPTEPTAAAAGQPPTPTAAQPPRPPSVPSFPTSPDPGATPSGTPPGASGRWQEAAADPPPPPPAIRTTGTGAPAPRGGGDGGALVRWGERFLLALPPALSERLLSLGTAGAAPGLVSSGSSGGVGGGGSGGGAAPQGHAQQGDDQFTGVPLALRFQLLAHNRPAAQVSKQVFLSPFLAPGRARGRTRECGRRAVRNWEGGATAAWLGGVRRCWRRPRRPSSLTGWSTRWAPGAHARSPSPDAQLALRALRGQTLTRARQALTAHAQASALKMLAARASAQQHASSASLRLHQQQHHHQQHQLLRPSASGLSHGSFMSSSALGQGLAPAAAAGTIAATHTEQLQLALPVQLLPSGGAAAAWLGEGGTAAELQVAISLDVQQVRCLFLSSFPFLFCSALIGRQRDHPCLAVA